MIKAYSLMALLLATFSAIPANGQFKKNHKKHQFIAAESREYIEGFNYLVQGNMINRAVGEDKKLVAVVRCIDGSNIIEWKTAEIPRDYGKNYIDLLLRTAHDLTLKDRVFKVFINDHRRFDIEFTNKHEWSVNGGEGSKAVFYRVDFSGNRDAEGYLRLKLPIDWIDKGKPATIRIKAPITGDSSWMAIYMNNDVVQDLIRKASEEIWFDIKLTDKGRTQEMEVYLPETYAGERAGFTLGGSLSGEKMLVRTPDGAYVKFTIRNRKRNVDGMSLELRINDRSYFTFPDIYRKKQVTRESGDFIIVMEGSKVTGSSWNLEVRKNLKASP